MARASSQRACAAAALPAAAPARRIACRGHFRLPLQAAADPLPLPARGTRHAAAARTHGRLCCLQRLLLICIALQR